MRILSFVMALTAVLLAAGPTFAAPPKKRDTRTVESPAEALLSEGIALRRSGNNLAALPKFEEAYRLSPSPRTTAQLGLCLESLARWVESEKRLEEALTSNDPWIEKNRAVLADALKTSRDNISYIEVLGEPAGAEVFMNGRRVGSLPLGTPIKHDGGSALIEIRAPGFVTASQTVQVAAHSRSEVFLKALPDATKLVATKGSEPPDQSMDVTSSAANEPPKSIFSSPWFWGATAVVVVGATVAILMATSSTTTGSIDCRTCSDTINLN